MRHELVEGPITVAKIRLHQSLRGLTRISHRDSRQPHLEADVDCAGGVVCRRVEIRQWMRVAERTVERDAKRRQRLHCHDPWRQRGCEIFRQKWPERLVLPRLDVARSPVVEKTDAEQMVL